MRLTPYARTSFSSSLCGALFGAQSPSMQCHRGVKGNFAFDHVLKDCFRILGSLVGYFAAVHFVVNGPKRHLLRRSNSVAFGGEADIAGPSPIGRS